MNNFSNTGSMCSSPVFSYFTSIPCRAFLHRLCWKSLQWALIVVFLRSNSQISWTLETPGRAFPMSERERNERSKSWSPKWTFPIFFSLRDWFQIYSTCKFVCEYSKGSHSHYKSVPQKQSKPCWLISLHLLQDCSHLTSTCSPQI